MATMANILLDKEILLESGTNELELLVFSVADYTFGINVAKVREVLPTAEITSLPRAHSSIRGVFKLRNNVIPCVSLMDHLGIASTRENPESTMILADFNQQQTAFLVDDVERIHRLSWQDILSVPGLEALSHTPVTALARCDDRLIVMLDFEMILDDVTDQFFRTDAVDNPLGLPREKLRILMAEDSPTVREAIGNTLRNSGYVQLTFCENGEEAWRWISGRLNETGGTGNVCDLVISDIEMPQVDGFHLTRRIKEHPQLKQLPVLLYSSIVTPDNQKKGRAVGADAQVAKPELNEVVRLADELIAKAQRETRASGLREASGTTATAAEPETSQTRPPATPQAAQPAPAPDAARQQPRPEASRPTPPVEPVPCEPIPARTGSPWTDADPPTADELQTAAAAVPAPDGVEPKLWRTFQRELLGRMANLSELFRRSGLGERDDELFRNVARTLHTIKSASMVLPLDRVTICTHLAESLLEKARDDRSQWPQEGLESYLKWLETILLPPGDINDALSAGHALEARLA